MQGQGPPMHTVMSASAQKPLAHRDPNLPLAPSTLNFQDKCRALEEPATEPTAASVPVDEVPAADCHRQPAHSQKLIELPSTTYVSPSDAIMSPCTAKLTALRTKYQERVKPRSLFAQTSTRKMDGSTNGSRLSGPTE